MRRVTLAATQFACSWLVEANLAKAEQLVRAAAAAGAQIILLQELFETPYFCQHQQPEHFSLSKPLSENPLISRFASLAKELQVVLPISYFERANCAHYNSIVVIDADGDVVGWYRKSHIPDGPGYQEKFYFSPGDTGFKVFHTRYAKIAALICWDQWFPEAARCVALQGAEVILYPTAIGSEPHDPTLNSYPHWIRVMCGHAGASMIPVVVSNRIGTETALNSSITFYGGSFIAGASGEILAQVGRQASVAEGWPDPKPAPCQGFVTVTVDLDALAHQRASWGIFRDRRPELYKRILTLDGVHTHQEC